MAILLSDGVKIEDSLTRVSVGYELKPLCLYQFHIMVSEEDFGGRFPTWRGITRMITYAGMWDFHQKQVLNETLDSYDLTDPYGESKWWGAGGKEVIVQIGNTQSRNINDIWKILMNVFETIFPESVISIIETYEGPKISLEEIEKGRRGSWYEIGADWFDEQQWFIKTALILGGIGVISYSVSSITKAFRRK